MTRCPSCNAENPTGAVTCAQCGAAMDQTVIAAPQLLAHLQGLLQPEPIISTGRLTAAEMRILPGDETAEAPLADPAEVQMQASRAGKKGLPDAVFDRLDQPVPSPAFSEPTEAITPIPLPGDTLPPAPSPRGDTPDTSVDETVEVAPVVPTPRSSDDVGEVVAPPPIAPPQPGDSDFPVVTPPRDAPSPPSDEAPTGAPIGVPIGMGAGMQEPAVQGPSHSATTLWMALLLLGAILFGRFFQDWPQLRPPIRPDVTAAHRLIADLPPGSRVLLAWDYEPTTQGEMQLLARPILLQLRQQQAVMAHMSLRPLGPVMAAAAEEAAYGDLSAAGPLFPPATDLGFLPGGAAALRSLALAPIAAASLPELSAQDLGMSRDDPLTAFALIIEFSAEAGTTQEWVEQIAVRQPTPLVVAASGVIAPALRPYAQTGQIAALLEGYPDALALENLLTGPGPAARQALAQTLAHLGLLTLVLLTLIRSVFDRHA